MSNRLDVIGIGNAMVDALIPSTKEEVEKNQINRNSMNLIDESHKNLLHQRYTIQEMIGFMSRQYQQTPENLEKTLHSVIERLVEEKVIYISQRITTLPYYLALPIEELDVEKAKQLMIEDNYFS